MYLSKLAIINYRSCRDIVIDLIEDIPTTFIGHADAGKTSIMKAIGLLADSGQLPSLAKEGHDTSDLSTTRVSEVRYKQIFNDLKLPIFDCDFKNSIIVLGIYKKQQDDFNQDFEDKASPHLKWSVESFSEDIAILRQFNESMSNGRYFICSQDNENNDKELWNENQTNLSNLIKKLKIENEEIENFNKKGRFKKIEKFRAIYNKSKTTAQWGKYEEYQKDKLFFPIYRYIDWKEITLKSVEDIAKETMASLIDSYEQKLKQEADKLSKKATLKLNKEFQKKTSIILSGIPSVTAINAKVFFNINDTVSEISVNKNTTDGTVSLESQGDGIKKQIGFAFMRLGAIQKIHNKDITKKYLWCFDEPETHLYPEDKREFYEIIKKLSVSNFQTLISTHSTIFVDKSKINTIKKVQLFCKYTTISYCSSVEDIQQSLGIKNSDFLFFDKFIVGEGETDKDLLPHLYSLYFSRSFEDDAVQFVSLGGSGNRKVNNKIFKQLLKDFKDPNDCVYYVFDKDQNFNASKVFSVGICDIEDSIDDKFWVKLVKDECGVSIKKKELSNIRKLLDPNHQDKKFHHLLKELVSTKKGRVKYLPNKPECGKLLTKYITKKKDIPSDIIKLFEEIKKDG